MSTKFGVSEAAKILCISPQRVRTLCREGAIKSQKIGNTWILDKEEVTKYGLKSAHMIAENHEAYEIGTTIGNKPIALSFFSGAMGLDLGIEKAGFDIRLACESDKYCRQTIALNRPNVALIGDINDYSAKDVQRAAGIFSKSEIDLIVGGPPCQAFSTAGKRKAFNDDRGNVFLKFLELALELKPKYLVIENVRGLLSCPMEHRPHNQRGKGYPDLADDEKRGGALNFVLSRLRSSGYGFSFNLYNSANFGTPQIRERVIIVCSRNGVSPPYLVPTHSETSEFGLKRWRTLKSVVNNIKTHHHLNFSEKRLKYYRLLKPGENWRNLPKKLQKGAMGNSFFAGGGKTGFYRRLAWDKPSPTLVTHPAMPATDLAHPEEDRPLSIEEYKRIQEFPNNWELAGPLVQQYKQVGNAVPISLGFAVGNLVRSLLENKPVVDLAGFQYSRYKGTDHLSWLENFSPSIPRNESKQQMSLHY